MSDAAQKQVAEFLCLFHAQTAPDLDTLSRYLTDDAVYWPLVPSLPPLHGLKAIFAGLQKQFVTYRDCRCDIHAIGTGDGVIFTERTDRVVLNRNDREVSVRVTAVFRTTADGKISDWREYWDSEDVLGQMGVSREAWNSKR
jgi:limonene-1,2-epoxide hydrolase